MKTIVKFEDKDNVAVVLTDSKENQEFFLGDERIIAIEEIPYGHKIALQAMKKGTRYISTGNRLQGARRILKKEAGSMYIM